MTVCFEHIGLPKESEIRHPTHVASQTDRGITRSHCIYNRFTALTAARSPVSAAYQLSQNNLSLGFQGLTLIA